MITDYYKILGVPSDASDETIRYAFHEKAKLYHPDVYSGPEGDRMFKLLNEAYRTLRNPQRRKQYDFKLRYGTLIDFQRTAQSEVSRRREEMRKEYIRRKRAEEEEGIFENDRTQKILNNVLFWSMGFILAAALIFSIVDAWVNYHFYMLVFVPAFIGLALLSYFQVFRKKKDERKDGTEHTKI